MVKATFVNKNGVKKGAWSEEEEDNKLRAYALRCGHWNWRFLPKFACLERMRDVERVADYDGSINLKPGVKRGNYSQEERDLIAKLHHELGNKWSAIAAKWPEKTDNDVKNCWHTHHKKSEKRNSTKSGQQADNFQKSHLQK